MTDRPCLSSVSTRPLVLDLYCLCLFGYLTVQVLEKFARLGDLSGDAVRGVGDQLDTVAPLVLEVVTGLFQFSGAGALGADVLQCLHRGPHPVRALAEVCDQPGQCYVLGIAVATHFLRSPRSTPCELSHHRTVSVRQLREAIRGKAPVRPV